MRELLTMVAWGALILMILAAGMLLLAGFVDSLFDRE
jgi:hypothetical protein